MLGFGQMGMEHNPDCRFWTDGDLGLGKLLVGF